MLSRMNAAFPLSVLLQPRLNAWLHLFPTKCDSLTNAQLTRGEKYLRKASDGE